MVNMTDQEIVQGLIARDNRVTEEFFFGRRWTSPCSWMRKSCRCRWLPRAAGTCVTWNVRLTS